jgi:UBX domain-containing protein 1
VTPNNLDNDDDDNENARDSVFSQAEHRGASGGGGDDDVRRTITMYRNGFVVDDGPYRRLDDPSNAEFLRSLAAGVTPRELLSEGDVTVGLLDKRKEDYVEKFQSFSGAGASLGTKTTGQEKKDDKDDTTIVDPESLPETPPVVDPNQPTTSIQVRLPNGQRKVIKINLTASVHDLAAHLRDVASGGKFRLLAGFPPSPLADLGQSVEAAGLKGASVSMQTA